MTDNASKPEPDQERKDFFISYTGADQTWAEWIAWQLEQDGGYSTVLQSWDLLAGGNFIEDMDRATKLAERTIAVLSPAYFQSRFARPEWQAAFRRDPTGEHGLPIPVRVRPCDMEGLLGAVVYIDLVDLDEQRAREQLLSPRYGYVCRDNVQNLGGLPLFPLVLPSASTLALHHHLLPSQRRASPVCYLRLLSGPCLSCAIPSSLGARRRCASMSKALAAESMVLMEMALVLTWRG